MAALIAAALAVSHTGAQNAPATPSTSPFAPFIAVSNRVFALEHARVIDGTGGPVRDDQTIVVESGRIVAVDTSARVTVPAGARRIDLTGRTVIPGIVGLHEHLFYPAGDGRNYKSHPVSFPRLYLAGGVTTARTAGTFDPETDLRVKADIDADRAIGPHLLITVGYMEGLPLSSPQMTRITTPQEARRFVESWAPRGVHSFKAYMHIRPAALAEAVQAAHEHGLTVTGHLCSVSFRQAAELGIDNLEHGFAVAADWVDERLDDECPAGQARAFEALDVDSPKAAELIRLLVAKHVAITSTLAVMEWPKVEPRFTAVLAPLRLESYLELRRNSYGLDHVTFPDEPKEVALQRAFVRAGGLLVAGADPTGDGQTLPGLADQRNIEMLVEGGFTVPEAIRIATLNGAELLKLSSRTGSIAVGKQADLVVIDGNPAARIEDIERVVTVFKDGVGYDSAKLLDSVKGRVGIE